MELPTETVFISFHLVLGRGTVITISHELSSSLRVDYNEEILTLMAGIELMVIIQGPNSRKGMRRVLCFIRIMFRYLPDVTIWKETSSGSGIDFQDFRFLNEKP